MCQTRGDRRSWMLPSLFLHLASIDPALVASGRQKGNLNKTTIGSGSIDSFHGTCNKCVDGHNHSVWMELITTLSFLKSTWNSFLRLPRFSLDCEDWAFRTRMGMGFLFSLWSRTLQGCRIFVDKPFDIKTQCGSSTGFWIGLQKRMIFTRFVHRDNLQVGCKLLTPRSRHRRH